MHSLVNYVRAVAGTDIMQRSDVVFRVVYTADRSVYLSVLCVYAAQLMC